MMNKTTMLMAILLLAGCAQKPGQDVYKAGEVGVSRAVEFGTVIGVREVKIAADNQGTGALLGAGTGAGAASYAGDGTGKVWAVAAGAIAGAVIGNAIEEEAGASQGYEYTLEMQNGDIKTIVQEKIEGDKVFKAGDKVRMETCDAGDHFRKCYPDAQNRQHQRLLPVDRFPSKAKSKTAQKE